MITRFGPGVAPGSTAGIGGKGAALCRLAAAGLPVPPGFCLTADVAAAVAGGDPGATAAVRTEWDALRGHPVAVRSSAADEDAAGTSFAGVHESCLHRTTLESVLAAIATVVESGRSERAQAYRARLGIPGAGAMGVVVQTMVPARAAGVAFTRNPVNGSDDVVVEAVFGLGEALVAGEVTPDHWDVGRDGTVRAHHPGDRDLAVVPTADGVHRIDVAQQDSPIDAAELASVVRLALKCEVAFGCPQDVEWAIGPDGLALLQSRAITR